VVDVGRVRKFLVGLYGEELLKESTPDLTTRHHYVGRDLRAVVPLKHELSGYHARWFSWFSHGPSSVDIDFPPRIHFTRPGDSQADRLELELERVGGVDGVIDWVSRNNLALQVSISYTSVGKGRLGRAYSGDVHALYLLMIEFEDKRGGNNLEPVKKVVNEVVDRAASFVEEPFIVFSGNKSYYLVFTLSTLVKAGTAIVRDRFGRVVREYGLNEVYRAIFDLVLRDKSYLGLGSEVIERFVDTQVAEPKRLLRIPGFTHEVSGKPTQQLSMKLTPIDFDPDALTKSILPNSVLTDYWAYIDLPREKGGRTGRKTTGERTGWDCLPSWVKTLIDYLRETSELCHYGRMAVAGWMIRCGFSDEEIHEVFKHAHDYKQGTTQYHINDVRKYLEKGGKPMGCETVVERCNGYKVPDLDCKAIRKHPTQPRPLEAKPEGKTEVKPEVKLENPVTPEVKVETRQEPTPNPQPETQVSESIPTPSPEAPKPETSKTKPGKPSTTNTSNRKVIKGSETKTGKQARLTGFIDKPTQPSIPTQSIEENWSKILRPEKRKVIDCKELGDECKFYHDWEELYYWHGVDKGPIFQPPEEWYKELALLTPQEHERFHKQLYELIINGKQQEALKLWEEFFNKVLARRMEERLRGG
jgi:hypothetical protein